MTRAFVGAPSVFIQILLQIAFFPSLLCFLATLFSFPFARLTVSDGGAAFSRRVVRTRNDGTDLECTRVFRRT